MTKIYTKTGDQGETCLFNGDRVPKSHLLIEAIGGLDECNSTIGLALSLIPEVGGSELSDQLTAVQHLLFEAGACIATPRSKSSERKLAMTRFDENAVGRLETWIDSWTERLPPLHAFILPGGHRCAAALHVARTICRRAERRLVEIDRDLDVDHRVVVFCNRLSDYLFTAARAVNHLTQTPEPLWRSEKCRSEQ